MMISPFAAEERKVKRQRLGDPLEMLDQAIDFLLVLQQLYNLSDEALEYQVLDRANFLRFTRLEGSSRIPDAKTVWKWRERLQKQDLIGDIGEAVGRQLSEAGFIARGGQIIDASIVTAPIQRNRDQEDQAIKHGEPPMDWPAAKRSQKDVDARWTRKHGKSYYGYKLHANTDRRWGFIRAYEVTAAAVADTEVFEFLLDPGNTRKDVYADRGYAKRARETQLRAKGYRDHIQRKGNKKPISAAQQRRNRRISRDRAYGEHPFARLAHMGGKHLRTIGLPRARVVIGLKVAAHNLMHFARLKHRGMVPA